MGETSGTVRLVAPRQDSEARGLVTTIRRDAVEEALRQEEPVDLLLDIERVTTDGGRETERVALAWETEELEQLPKEEVRKYIAKAFEDPEHQAQVEAWPVVSGLGNDTFTVEHRETIAAMRLVKRLHDLIGEDIGRYGTLGKNDFEAFTAPSYKQSPIPTY